jgi:hypothetical protein
MTVRRRLIVAEVLLEFAEAVTSEDGKNYTARACGVEMPDGRWQGWVEFIPLGDGEPVRSSRETTQPNRVDTEYWASGLTYVYLQGALHRALARPVRPAIKAVAPPFFDGPAERIQVVSESTDSVLDPFAVYRKSEAHLRRQLSALAGWHLINIIRRYELSDEDQALLGGREPAELVETIISGVRNARPLAG